MGELISQEPSRDSSACVPPQLLTPPKACASLARPDGSNPRLKPSLGSLCTVHCTLLYTVHSTAQRALTYCSCPWNTWQGLWYGD